MKFYVKYFSVIKTNYTIVQNYLGNILVCKPIRIKPAATVEVYKRFSASVYATSFSGSLILPLPAPGGSKMRDPGNKIGYTSVASKIRL